VTDIVSPFKTQTLKFDTFCEKSTVIAERQLTQLEISVDAVP
jgi:hypothetical protein